MNVLFSRTSWFEPRIPRRRRSGRVDVTPPPDLPTRVLGRTSPPPTAYLFRTAVYPFPHRTYPHWCLWTFHHPHVWAGWHFYLAGWSPDVDKRPQPPVRMRVGWNTAFAWSPLLNWTAGGLVYPTLLLTPTFVGVGSFHYLPTVTLNRRGPVPRAGFTTPPPFSWRWMVRDLPHLRRVPLPRSFGFTDATFRVHQTAHHG